MSGGIDIVALIVAKMEARVAKGRREPVFAASADRLFGVFDEPWGMTPERYAAAMEEGVSRGLLERTTEGIGILPRYWPAPYAYRLARGAA